MRREAKKDIKLRLPRPQTAQTFCRQTALTKTGRRNTRSPGQRLVPLPVHKGITMKHNPMPRGNRFKTVESIARILPDVEVTTTWGQPALKVRGKMFVCIASHKSAEPNTLVVMMDFAARDALIEDDPGTYYLKEHYLNYPCVLVRLSRVSADALNDLVVGAYRFMRGSLGPARRRQQGKAPERRAR